MRPDELFTAAQQQRLAELMDRWRAARDAGTALPQKEQAELDALVEAELRTATDRSATLVRQLPSGIRTILSPAFIPMRAGKGAASQCLFPSAGCL